MKKSKAMLLSAGLTAATGIAVLAVPGSASAHSYDYYHDTEVSQWQNDNSDCQDQEAATLVDTLASDGRFTTLLAAVKAAGLEDALNAPGDKTVFAPTDEAFAALPEGTVESLLNDKAALTNILQTHVVAGAVDADAALYLGQATTLNGQTLQIGEGDDGVYVNDSKLLETDIMTSNGVIHVIDSVLLPQ